MHAMSVESHGEISMVVYEFRQIFDHEIEIDKARFNETNPYYGVYRALKETLRSETVNSMKLNYVDVYSLVHFLLEEKVTNFAFREWIKTRSFEWENGWLSKNAYRIYTIGKQEILKNMGKKKSNVR